MFLSFYKLRSLAFIAGPDSPTSSLKDLTTHTRALKLKHQSLEERLELCLLELRQLCIREAVRVSSIQTHTHVIVYFDWAVGLQIFWINRSWRVRCLQTILWCLMRIRHMSGGESELHSSWTKGWSFEIKRCKKNPSLLKQKSATICFFFPNGLNFRFVCLFFYRIPSCKHWKQTWLFISRFMKRPANSPWRSISVNHRRRAGCSSARGRRKKWNNCRRLCSSIETKASATHRASPFQGAKSVVSAAAPFRPTIVIINEWIRGWKRHLFVQIWACPMTVPCLMWWLWTMVSSFPPNINIFFEYEPIGDECFTHIKNQLTDFILFFIS